MKKLSTFHTIMASIESATDATEKMFKDLGITEYAFIGGLATIFHGYPRTTHDVDVIIRANDFDKIYEDMDRLTSYGFNIGAEGELWHKDGTKVELLVEESRFFKSPDQIVPFLSDIPRSNDKRFPDLITHFKLKSTSGRSQDIADIVNLIKNLSIEEEALKSILNNLDSKQKENFKRALSDLKKEDERYLNLNIEG